jgi:hypothetical protein
MAEQVRGLNEMLGRYQVLESALTAHTNTAAAPNGAAASRADLPVRAERRGSNRPWAGKAGRSSAATAVADAAPAKLAVARATGNGADTDWREF